MTKTSGNVVWRTLIATLTLGAVLSCANLEDSGEPSDDVDESATAMPMSFTELADQLDRDPAPVETIKAHDDIAIAFRIYHASKQENTDRPVLLFYHGGGAHSGAGYQSLGYTLAEDYGITVVTPDLRGHGMSDGPVGDAPTVDAVYRDISAMFGHLRSTHPDARIYIGGHSSGAGLLLNALTSDYPPDADGIFFVAPQFGFRAETDRNDHRESFAEARTFPFVVNAMTGGLLMGNSEAVRFNYPQDLLEGEPSMTPYNTVNMANAVTPRAPSEQLAELSSAPTVWVAEEDELIDPGKVETFTRDHQPSAAFYRIDGKTHLSILLRTGELIGETIR